MDRRDETASQVETDGDVAWVAARRKHDLSPPERALVRLWCDACATGAHNLDWKMLERFGDGAAVTTNRDVATFDGAVLTRLVILAHDRCLRVSVEGIRAGLLRIMAHPRVREGSRYERHPTIEDAIASVRR